MIELQTVTTKAKNPSTNEFQDVTWGGINVLSTSGTTNYNNLTNKPTINGVTVQGSLTTGDLLITAADVGALPSGTKYGADFALSIDSQTFVVTTQLKDQDGNNLGQAKTIDLPLETMVVGGSYDDTTQKVILTLKNGQTVEFSVADLVSGLQSEITLNNKLDADLIDDSTSTNKFVTASDKTNWNAKSERLTILTYGTSTWNDFITAYENNAIVYCKAYMTGAQTRLAFMAYIDNDSAPTYVEFQYYRSVSSKNLSNQCDQVIVYKLDNTGTWTTTTRNTDVKFAAGTALGADFASNTLTFKHQNSGVKAGTYDSVTVDAQGHVTAGSNYTVSQAEQDAEIAVIANAGAKNFASKNSGSGTNSTAIPKTPITLPIGDYICSFSASSYSGNFAFELWDASNSQQYVKELTVAQSNSFKFTVTGDMSVAKYSLYVNNATISDFMIRSAAITDSTFVPYAKTNRELTNENETNKNNILLIAQNGVVNILANTAVTTTAANGLTYTVNADKSVTVTGNASAYYAFTIAGSRTYANAMPLKRGTYIIKAGIAYDSSKPIFVQFGVMTSSEASISWQNIYDTDKELVVNNDTTRIVYELYNPSGSYSGYNATFYPMILDKSLYDAGFTDYQPYALSNLVITPGLIKQVDEGAKNIADFTSATKTTYTTFTSRGVTITRNGDIFTVSGTSDTNDNIFFNIYYEGSTTTKIIPPGNWVALIEDYTGSVVKDIAVQIAAPQVPPAKPYGTPVKFSLSGSESGNWLRVNIRPSTTYNGSFRLMICSQEDYAVSQKFVPYALSNPVLTPAAIKAVDEGAKNLLRFDETSTDNNNVRFTVNADGTITATQIAARTATATFRMRYTDNLLSQDVRGKILSGCPSGGSDSTYKINIERRTSPYTNYGRDIGNGLLIPNTIADDIPLYLYIQVYSTATLPLTFKPMICTLADWNVSQKYVPYCPSLPDIFKWDEYECLYTSSPTVIAKLNTSTSSVKVRINKALRRVVIYFNIVFISDFIHGTDEGFGFGTINNISNYKSFYPFSPVSTYYITEDCSAVITKNSTNALIGITCSSGQISTGTTIVGQFEYTY